MTTFRYRGFDVSGKTRSGLLEAADLKQARKKLSDRSILAEHVAPAAAAREGALRRRSLAAENRAALYRELGSALRAGLPLARSLDMLIDTPETGRAANALAAARDRIQEGASLAGAFAEAMPGMPAHETALLEAGEKTATLDLALDKLADFLERHAGIRAKLLSALVYPAFVLALGAVIAIGLLGFAVPRMARLLLESGQHSLPRLTTALIAFGAALFRWGPALAAAAALAALWARRKLKTDPAAALALDRFLFRLPLYGRGYTLLAKARFCRALALLVSGGIPAVEAMALAGKATGSPLLAALLAEQSESVRHGDSIATALRRIPEFGEDLCNWVEVGEAGGSLPQMLENAGLRFQAKWETLVTRATALLEPALIALVGAVVFLIVLGTLLPIISLNNALL